MIVYEEKECIGFEKNFTRRVQTGWKISLTVILDNVRSLNNIGSVFRTADAFRVECIYLCGITATPPHTDIHKTALGAEDSVDWVYFQDTCEAVDNLLAAGYEVYAVEQVECSISLTDIKLDKNKNMPSCWVMKWKVYNSRWSISVREV